MVPDPHSIKGGLPIPRNLELMGEVRILDLPEAREMGEYGIIVWLIIGAIAGWLAGRLVKGGGFGLIGDIVVGILGAVIGGWLSGVLGISIGSGFIASVITAIIGAVILLVILRAIKRA